MRYVIDVAPNLWADTFGRPGLSAPVLESTATGFAPVWASPVMRPGLFDTKDAKSSKLTKVVFRCRRPGPGCLSRECNVAFFVAFLIQVPFVSKKPRRVSGLRGSLRHQ